MASDVIEGVARTATPDDINLLASLGSETARIWFADVYDDQEMEAFIERDFSAETLGAQLSAPARHTYLLMEAADRPVGFARINWKKHVPLSDSVGAELQKIYFLPAFTGQGLGLQLMQRVYDSVTEKGESLLWLDVLSTNPRARRWYERQGFLKTGSVPYRTRRGNFKLDVMVQRLKRR